MSKSTEIVCNFVVKILRKDDIAEKEAKNSNKQVAFYSN